MDSNTSGVLHELIVGYYLNNQVHMKKRYGTFPEAEHDYILEKVQKYDYAESHNKAKAAAEHITRVLPEGTEIIDVCWSAKPGVIGMHTGFWSDQVEDPSDLILTVKLQNGKERYIGLSLKSTRNFTQQIQLSNHGISTIKGGSRLLNEHRAGILRDYPVLNLMNGEQRKAFLRSNRSADSDIRARNSIVLENIAENLCNVLNEMDNDALISHIKEVVLGAKLTPMQREGHFHYIHLTQGSKGAYRHSIKNPSSTYDHFFANPDNICAVHSGTSVLFYSGYTKIGRQRVKFATQSDPLSSIKCATSNK